MDCMGKHEIQNLEASERADQVAEKQREKDLAHEYPTFNPKDLDRLAWRAVNEGWPLPGPELMALIAKRTTYHALTAGARDSVSAVNALMNMEEANRRREEMEKGEADTITINGDVSLTQVMSGVAGALAQFEKGQGRS